MDHRMAIRQTPYSKLCLALVLTGIAVCIKAQTPNSDADKSRVIIRVETIIPEKEDVSPANPTTTEVRSELVDCEQKYPLPENMKSRQAGQEAGEKVCARLVLQGQRLQCEVDKLVSEQPNTNVSGLGKTEIMNWVRCNEKVTNLLINGYYLPASEIERRLQICRSNFYADPGNPQKLGDGFFDRLVDLVKGQFKQLAKKIHPSLVGRLESDPTVQPPSLLQSQESAAGLMQCEWMFATSKTPQIDPLPNLTPTKVTTPSSPTKAPVKKTP